MKYNQLDTPVTRLQFRPESERIQLNLALRLADEQSARALVATVWPPTDPATAVATDYLLHNC